MDLARPKQTQSQVVALHALLEEIAGVLSLQPLMSSIRIDIELDADQDAVWANTDQLRQVFLNLLLNAADAISMRADRENGVVRIRTRTLDSNANEKSQRIQIDFEDNGVGMSSEQMDNIFDPFYTTKEPGKGTGLGLAVSYMIVERIGGTIIAHSIPGQGSTLSVQIPLTDEK